MLNFPQISPKEGWDFETVKGQPLVFDIETNGLLPSFNEVWVIVCINPVTLQTWAFSDYDDDLLPLEEGLRLLKASSKLIGHHILGFDLVALARKYGWWHTGSKVDTLVMSKTLDYHRFGNGFRHSLADWGKFLGMHKPEHEDWSKYTKDMLRRCLVDTQINVMIYHHLSEELNNNPRKARLKLGLKAEMGIAEFVGRSYIEGWKMDKPLMQRVFKSLELRMEEIRREIEPKLLPAVDFIDKAPKTAKFVKNGNYNAFTARWFDLSPGQAHEPRIPVKGEFRRIEVKRPEIGNPESVKKFLETIGWEPDEWNWKRVDGKLIKMSSKLTESSLEKVPKYGAMISEYYTARARYGILKGWLESLGDSEYLVGDMFTIGTPTGRATHQGIANIPSVASFEDWISEQGEEDRSVMKSVIESKKNPFDTSIIGELTEKQKKVAHRYARDTGYGPYFRSFFTSPEGWTMIGADSSGCQVRALCHYLKNDEYTKTVISGDVHQLHTDIVQKVVPEATRSKMKRVFFAMIFGAGVPKLGNYLVGYNDAKVGSAAKEALIHRIEGFSRLLNRINALYDKTEKKKGGARVYAIDGRPVYLDSSHKGLNYVVQSCEAVTCKMAGTHAMERLDKEIGPENWKPLVFYHDEIEFIVKDQFADKAMSIAKESFKTGPEEFGVTIMDGDAKKGKNWLDVH